MKHVTVWEFLFLLSSCRLCLQWTSATPQFPSVYKPWQEGEGPQQENWGLGTGLSEENNSIQGGISHASPNAAEGGTGNVEAPAPPVDNAASVFPASVHTTGGPKLASKVAAIGFSLLIFYLGLFTFLTRGETPPPTPIEAPSTPAELPAEEQPLEVRLRNISEAAHTSKVIADVIGTPYALTLQSEIERAVEELKEPQEEHALEENLKAANRRIGDLSELGREYVGSLAAKHASTVVFPVLTVKDGDKDVPLVELVNMYDDNTVVRSAFTAFESLREEFKSTSEFISQLSDELRNGPAYETEQDRAELEHLAGGVGYLTALVETGSRSVTVASRLKSVVVEGMHALMCREVKDAVLSFESDCDMFQAVQTVMKRSEPPPTTDPSDYLNACNSLEKRLAELQGVGDEMNAQMEELQRSRSLQSAYQATVEFGQTMDQAEGGLRNAFDIVTGVGVDLDVLQKGSPDLIPDKVALQYALVSQESRSILDMLQELGTRVEKLRADRVNAPSDDVVELSADPLATMLTEMYGIESTAEGVLASAKEQQQALTEMAGEQDIAAHIREYTSRLAALQRAKSSARMLSAEVAFFLALEEELKRQVDIAAEAANFNFPVQSSFGKKMRRLEELFSEAVSEAIGAKVLTNVEECLAKTRGLLETMGQLIRVSLART
ncbi:hypothetical protein, conserved [Eimeria acervulina]|uniref:Uncharacterized protein n=1 Tax=Eimeria acervulina TaxID=5801 RepID=U6GMA9_EIMAC|nr:hypothetical protein, conserved [Eimeria acervulina]CDI79739.1 hypothetical protein, conserved [Eimeria acervulina]